ncbi:MAG: hypothetical protein AAF648_08390, partial [Pseudomonadota bacterium]
MSRFLSLCLLLLAGSVSAPHASADLDEIWLTGQYIDVDCAQIFCGYIKANPKVSLLSVNPNPLPEVEEGESQTLSITWSAEQGLKTTFELCITDSVGAPLAASDGCVALQGNNITHMTNRYVYFAETVEVPAALRRPEADFYVRSTAGVFLFRQDPASQVSNRRSFSWPIPLPNLNIEGAGTNYAASRGTYTIDAEVRNVGTIDVQNIEVAMEVLICDASVQPLPTRPGSTKPNDILCYDTAPSFIGRFGISMQTVPYLPAGARETVAVNVTAQMPPEP